MKITILKDETRCAVDGIYTFIMGTVYTLPIELVKDDAPYEKIGISQFRISMDVDRDESTQPMARAVVQADDYINGKMTCQFDCNTEKFKSVTTDVTNCGDPIKCFLEISGIDQDGVVLCRFQIDVYALGAVDPDATKALGELTQIYLAREDFKKTHIVEFFKDGEWGEDSENSTACRIRHDVGDSAYTVNIPLVDTRIFAKLLDLTTHNESETAHPDIRVELGSKANASDVATALNGKVDKVAGKGLSTNDYDNTDKSKVDALGSMSAEDTEDYRTAADQDLIDAGKVNSNAAITGATKTKITYDSKGLVTAGADLEESDIPHISASKVTGLATVATGGSYNDLSNKPLDRETVPMSITGYAVEGYPVARLDDVYDTIEIYKNAVGLAVVEMTVRSADNTITGNIVLIPVVNGVDGDPVTIAVTASWAKVSFVLEIPAGTLALRRDHASTSDTLKDGASVVTAQVIDITYRSSVL